MPYRAPVTRRRRLRAPLLWTASSVLVLPVAISCFHDESSASFGGIAGSRAAGGAFPGFGGAAAATGVGTAGSPSRCNPDFCPATPQTAPCCVSEGGPCGVETSSGCVAETSPACSLPPRADATCPHQALCEAACAAITGPCAETTGFGAACLLACCHETRDAAAPCATCIAGGLRATLSCTTTCTCNIAFAAAGSDACGAACAERRFGRCDDDAECGLGVGSCQSLCEVRVCVDPATPSCVCDGTDSCPTGSTCICGCGAQSFCATSEERQRLCTESQGACFGCESIPPPPVVDAGSQLDATVDGAPSDGAAHVTDSGGDATRVLRDATADATNGSMARDAGDAG